jgi:aryl-alcohol dehydrogenase-like predicted oxidoreductase
MEYRRLGRNGPEVSAIGFGCWEMGGSGYGSTDEAEVARAVHRAIDLGVTLFDTAPVYGFGGSEEALGRALGKRRDEVVLVSKGGQTWDPVTTTRKSDARYSQLKGGLEDTLRRLGTDHLDLFLIHWPDPETPIEESMKAVDDMVAEGKTRYVGVCNHASYELRECAKHAPVVTNQVGYNMFDRRWEREMFPTARELGVNVMAYGPMAHGLLTGAFQRDQTFEPGDWRRSGMLFGQRLLGPNLAANLDVVDELRGLAEGLGTTLPRLALAWVIRDPIVAVALSGCRTVAEIEENVKAVEVKIPRDALARVDAALDKVVGRSETIPARHRPPPVAVPA